MKETIENEYRPLNIISLVHAKQEITRLIPMLLSQMVYNNQKDTISGKQVFQAKHLIIDEAHNILNSEYKGRGDNWQDYRLSIFEEIIKEREEIWFLPQTG
ncbi:hypothetical protein [Bacillus cytotoxicus]|uniref:hypothetical protein n=1 Tax=Bacillus cytotoxicus TaxID=580165 RepID=UPI003D7EFC0D